MCSGAQAGNTFPTQIATRYGAIAQRDLADFVRKSQMAMYETYKAMYEGRQAKLFNPCSGVLTWMSNPSQPSFVWQIYSYDLEPLAALYGAKKACEPLHVQLNQNDWHVMVVNTLPQPKKGHAGGRAHLQHGRHAEVREDAAGERQAVRGDRPGRAGSGRRAFRPCITSSWNSRTRRGSWFPTTSIGGPPPRSPPTAAPQAADIFGSGGLGRGGRGGGAAGRRAARREDFSLLQTLPTAEVQVTLKRHDAAGKCLIDATIANPTKIPALQVACAASQTAAAAIACCRCTITIISSRCCRANPEAVTIEAAVSALGGQTPEVAVDGWNVTVAARSFPDGGGAAVALNKDAFVGPK